MRELALMAEGRDRAEWRRFAALMALIHNVNCSKKSDTKRPSDFDPYVLRKPRPKVKLAALAALWGIKP